MRPTPPQPLHIDSLPLGNGQLGLTLCPGKTETGAHGVACARDLEADMDAIRAWGAEAVLSLIEDHEIDMLAVPRLGAAVNARGMAWFRFPIADLGVPAPAAMQGWRGLSPRLHAILERGGRILVHCRGGLGRAGTISARLLIERGAPPARAIRTVRSARPGAIETAVQERWLADTALHDDRRGTLLQASLLGGAMGDSLGAGIELLSLDRVRRRFPEGITDLPAFHGQRGAITDDTQMTLFTAEGLIRAHVQAARTGAFDPSLMVHHALLRWLRTQGHTPLTGTDEVGLIEDPRLWVRRGPGRTCLAALSECRQAGAVAANDSKGCGTIMRIAPVALMVPRDRVRDSALAISALTHGHATGQLAAAAWAEMLADVAAGAELEETAAGLAGACDRLKHGAETAQAIRNAIAAPRDGTPETVETLGTGHTAETALSIALYANLAGDTVEDGLQIAVLHGGDSDSTGAIAGNMLGLRAPDALLQHRWAPVIEGADLITRLVQDFRRVERDPAAAASLAMAYPGT